MSKVATQMPAPSCLPTRSRAARSCLLAGAALAFLSGCPSSSTGSADGSTGSADGGLALDAATTHTVSVMMVSPVRATETFRFVLGGAVVAITASGVPVAFSTALVDGTAYSVAQTDGPRICQGSANRSGTIAGRDVVITMDCGQLPGDSLLDGQLHAPVGTTVVLQLNGGSDLSLTMPPFAGSADPYNLLPFSFPAAMPYGTAFQVSIKTAPSGQRCSVYKGATGTLPVAPVAVRVGCEWIYDHVSRSTDNSVRATYFETTAPVMGGASVPIGSTTDGYGEGRFVAFVSNAVGLAGATGAFRQVYWRDRLTGETLLISASAAGVEGNGDSSAPALSADGLKVAFDSRASNLVSGDTNGVRDVFVWSDMNRQLAAQRLSIGLGGAEANGDSYEPTLSGDGKVVAFTSSASNLTAGVADTSTPNVIRRDLATGTNTLVSADPSTGLGVGGGLPTLSEDGRRLVFCSVSAAITPGDANGLWDIFVYDHGTGTNVRVSLATGGGERNQGSESASRLVAASISGDGRHVAFATTASNLVAGDTNGAQDVFVVDTQTGSVLRASTTSAGLQGNGDSPVGQGERVALSYDGSWVAFTTSASNLGPGSGNIILRNLVTGELRSASSQTGSSVGQPALSRTGAYVAFGAGAQLDERFPSTGVFAYFTGIGRSWWWYD